MAALQSSLIYLYRNQYLYYPTQQAPYIYPAYLIHQGSELINLLTPIVPRPCNIICVLQNNNYPIVSLYGQGVYFARDASYSHGYAQPDPDQHHYVYLTRVLTGEFTVGQQNMLVPPPKPNQQNSNVLYDSTVDRASSPIIFVVYNDAQAYAAYLITYQ